MSTRSSFKEYFLLEMTKAKDLKKISAYAGTIITHLIKLLYFIVLSYERKGWLVEIDAKFRLIVTALSEASSQIDEATILEELLRVSGRNSASSQLYVKGIRERFTILPAYKRTRATNRSDEEIFNIITSIMAEAAHLLYEKKPVKIVKILKDLQLSEEGDEQ